MTAHANGSHHGAYARCYRSCCHCACGLCDSCAEALCQGHWFGVWSGVLGCAAASRPCAVPLPGLTLESGGLGVPNAPATLRPSRRISPFLNRRSRLPRSAILVLRNGAILRRAGDGAEAERAPGEAAGRRIVPRGDRRGATAAQRPEATNPVPLARATYLLLRCLVSPAIPCLSVVPRGALRFSASIPSLVRAMG